MKLTEKIKTDIYIQNKAYSYIKNIKAVETAPNAQKLFYSSKDLRLKYDRDIISFQQF
jgi:hypothetical protein